VSRTLTKTLQASISADSSTPKERKTTDKRAGGKEGDGTGITKEVGSPGKPRRGAEEKKNSQESVEGEVTERTWMKDTGKKNTVRRDGDKKEID
jgi:hypothetical protein